MNQKRIWGLWRAAPVGHNTADIARRLDLPVCEVDKVVSRCLASVFCDLPMPWNRSAA